MAKADLGAKRVCQNCGTKFFDFNKDPISCPKCGAAVPVAALPKSAPRAARVEEEDAVADSAGAETVALEEADGDGAKVAVAGDDDAEIEEDAADTFLEEEEESQDDVAGLIDGEIESDEEA